MKKTKKRLVDADDNGAINEATNGSTNWATNGDKWDDNRADDNGTTIGRMTMGRCKRHYKYYPIDYARWRKQKVLNS